MKVGIIGCGFIGTEIAKFIDKNKGFKLIGLCDIEKKRMKLLVKKLRNNKPVFMNLEDLVKHSELIIESASKEAVQSILRCKSLDKKGKVLLIMSTGGLIKNINLLRKLKKCEVIIPSGAISGLDAVKSVAGKIKSLKLTTTKHVSGLESAPYIKKNKINLKDLKNKKIIFEGGLKKAINGFPQNINVAATLYLASKFKDIKVKIIADPNIKANSHEIEIKGDFGTITTITKNVPSQNPKTSYLAVLSAIEILKNINGTIKIGN